jgi:hypothetical protein
MTIGLSRYARSESASRFVNGGDAGKAGEAIFDVTARVNSYVNGSSMM